MQNNTKSKYISTISLDLDLNQHEQAAANVVLNRNIVNVDQDITTDNFNEITTSPVSLENNLFSIEESYYSLTNSTALKKLLFSRLLHKAMSANFECFGMTNVVFDQLDTQLRESVAFESLGQIPEEFNNMVNTRELEILILYDN
ncbi:unnamed protein product [Rotaria sp. Silwood1]|nr:unnamed protein product [Rotaria sp. Silwood1]